MILIINVSQMTIILIQFDIWIFFFSSWVNYALSHFIFLFTDLAFTMIGTLLLFDLRLHPKFIYGFPTYPQWDQIDVVLVLNFIQAYVLESKNLISFIVYFGSGTIHFCQPCSDFFLFEETLRLICFNYITCQEKSQNYNFNLSIEGGE